MRTARSAGGGAAWRATTGSPRTVGGSLGGRSPGVRQLRAAPDWGLAALAGEEEPDPCLALVHGPVGTLDWNDPALLAAPVPGAGGVATARSLARLDGALARGGELDGVRVLRAETIDAARTERSAGPDVISGIPLRSGLGFELWGIPSFLGPSPDAFGHTGAGGSSHGAWPGLRTGWSFVTAELQPATRDVRAATLLEALHACAVAAG